ncbi:septal ring lytic transglycosylase RlpA family protein [Bacterioplanoides sp.]|uniref:septal ring lytic transglycosylase RlpA family protein n=1 Tax=Bacterioplanoides sp. TaxID=2066072 RepID=UPI003B5C0D99
MQHLIILLLLAGALSACTPSRYKHSQDFTPAPIADIQALKEPVAKAEAKSVMGNTPRYTVLGKEYEVMPNADNYSAEGIASWYGMKFHGHRTSNGEIYDVYQFTAAHKTLPLPSYVRVTRLDTQQSVVVRVNDRGPFHEGRIIDLSYAAAVKLGINKQGTAQVKVDIIHPPKAKTERWVQIGALSDPSAALRLQQTLVEKLQGKWPVAINKPAKDSQRPLHKVRIGPVEEGDDLDQLLLQLKQLKFDQPLLLAQHQL